MKSNRRLLVSLEFGIQEKKKVTYLFGAAATHAELVALNPYLIPEQEGLLISNVSSRVIEKARLDETTSAAMADHSSASTRQQTPHANRTTRTNTIVNALKQRVLSVLSDESIDAETRAVIR
ncbi:MAG TPA: hypothetical protein VHS05_13410 [Pyrinomonadaceae bacterium]|jgi:hypothetical protein|nr:hypothetical protein [Pyrinomonadaceae bacterium]